MSLSESSIVSENPGIPADALCPGGDRAAPARARQTGRIFDIKRFAIHDGPGIRSTVFFTGCPLRCAWCHNPEAFALEARPEDSATRVREVGVDELIRELERDLPYYDRSGGGVTLSGGEPLGQPEFVEELLASCRKRELHTAVDTCGAIEPARIEMAARLADLILYDLKLLDDAAHAEWTGSGNTLILETLAFLDTLDVEVWIRIPVIPGANDTPEQNDAFIAFLRTTRFRRVSLLPYHRIADAKYQRLGLPNRMAGIAPPSADKINSLRARFADAGFDTRVGG
jgi:pyruvate formate lyase activating enzyme